MSAFVICDAAPDGHEQEPPYSRCNISFRLKVAALLLAPFFLWCAVWSLLPRESAQQQALMSNAAAKAAFLPHTSRSSLTFHPYGWQQERGTDKVLRSRLINAAEGEERVQRLPPPTWTPPPSMLQRRQILISAASMLGAEAAWRQAVANAAVAIEAAPLGSSSSLLPPGTIEQIESGRVVTIKNWMSPGELATLRADAKACFAAGHFKADALASYGQKKKSGFDPANDRMVMPSFFPSKGTDGPWVDPNIGDIAARQKFKARMAEVKVLLSKQLKDRPTLADDGQQTHEMSYTRYGPSAFLARHVDEHHIELKKRPGTDAATRTAPTPKATRRSVTWLLYLNDDWNAKTDGGELRVHERAKPSVARVGARGPDLQIGWLRATATQSEQPVFLDARRPGNENCCMYTFEADGSKRDLSRKPFSANPVLYMSGGDFLAKKLLVDDPADAERFHLLDAPKSAASDFLPRVGDTGEDGGERVRDIAPEGGTLVLFDSVCIPHQVLATKGRERFALSGWFHEKLYG